MAQFNYETKSWGANEVDLSPWFLGATRLKYCLTALKEIPQGKVLEVGCGGGAFLRAIKRHRPELKAEGCDISKKVLKIARKMAGGVRYKQANVYDLPFAKESCQAVVSFDVLEHLYDPKKALKEINRVLHKKGIFHFFVPLEGNKSSLFQILPKKIYKIKKEYTGHQQTFVEKKLRNILTQSGFRVEKIHYSCFYFYQLIDLLYFLFLRLKGRNATVSVEGYLQLSKGSFFDILLTVLKNFLSSLFYLENEVFIFLPGGGIHVTAKKVKREKSKAQN